MRFVANPKYSAPKKNKEYFFSLREVRAVTEELLNNATIAPSNKLASVLNLTVKDELPVRGNDIIKELLKSYNRAAIDDKNALASNTLAFVENRLKYVVGELDSVESKIQQYKSARGIVDISEQGKLFLETVGTNDKKLGEINTQLAVLDQVESYVNDKNDKSGIVPSTLGVSDPMLTQLLEKMYASELEYERLKRTTAENNPILVSLSNQIQKIKPSILEIIRSQRRNLVASKSNISTSNEQYSSMLRTIPQKERELLEISRQQEIKNSIYTFLLQKREETALSYASAVADSRLIDNPQSTVYPVSPNSKLVYAMAIVAAICLGIGFIVAKESLNRTIMFRKEIEDYTEFPVIGEISHSNNRYPVVVSDGNRSFIAEQFRQLRTSVGFMGINSRKKRILITSSISGEGKSFITVNLGVSMALTGKKVVILELDLRKPQISEMLNVSRETGITTYLEGFNEANEVLKMTGASENLFLIPAGPIPANPSELILNGKLQELLDYLNTKFDYILIDTAPVTPVTDAYILSPFCDATLFIIRHGHTPKTSVKLLDQNTMVKGMKNLGIVFNGVKARGFNRAGSVYGYGYSSNYKYEDKVTEKVTKKKGLPV
jgi:capsular exopolysaccharide synthesis family protein